MVGLVTKKDKQHETGQLEMLCLLSSYLASILPVLFVNAVNVEVWPLLRLDDSELCRQQCHSKIYCEGPLLASVQRGNIFVDSKRFVDMPGRYSEEEIIRNFNRLPGNSKDTLLKFVMDNFDRPGHELRVVVPGDWKEEPALVKSIKDPKLLNFATIVHSKWKSLVRRVDPDRSCQGCASSIVPLSHPFVVPGGRFRELYYWDTFWILEGLFVSEMCDTALMILKNYMGLIKKFGFIPNGSRQYYLNRSQPPLFTQMIKRYLERCVESKDKGSFIKEILPFAEQEYMFWMKFRSVEVPNPKDAAGRPFKLSRYHADTKLPRPESYLEDTLTAQNDDVAGGARERLFQQIASGAESGWDFSSRWFSVGPSNFTSIITSNIIPVDLNSIMYKNEVLLAEFTDIGGDTTKKQYYEDQANHRLKGMKAMLWKDDGWMDYDFIRGISMNKERGFIVSDLSPLWFIDMKDLGVDPDLVEKMLRKHWSVLWKYPGGIPIGEVVSGQQWDFPNVWAPIQYYSIILFETLSKSLPKSKEFWEKRALEAAQKFINTTYCGHKNYGTG